jgi:Methyltransferase domain
MRRDTLVYWGATYAATWSPRPLVQPASEDIAYFESRVRRAAGTNLVTVLLLGVTRPLAAMQWPDHTDLVALDWSEPVIRKFWRREGVVPGAAVVRGDWREIPLASGSRQIALSDGCYHCLTSHDDGALLSAEVRRVLDSNGHFFTRNFLAPERIESLDSLFDELHSGAAGSLHVFRWRLAAALQRRGREGVPRHVIGETWQRRAGDLSRLKATYGDGDGGISVFERYRNLDGRLFYFTLADLQEMIEP